MSTFDSSAVSRADDELVPVDEKADRRVDTTEGPPRRLLDRMSEAVRAAHTASVPF
ncbi:hypothetical protein [Pseudonocardia sp. GCM10023141]|uniref:hypothetical protein n=1 Tax=Pseudonocardia sp. GCM10023141 TaxID=3252653 RepID=UPI00360685BE